MADRQKPPKPPPNIAKTSIPARSGRTDTTRPPFPSLLGIPPELRNRIYEYVLCRNLVHISTRPCNQDDPQGWRAESSPSLPQDSVDEERVKWTHTLCSRPDAWPREYRTSQRPENIPKECYTASGALNIYAASDDVVVRDYATTHNACLWVQDDFREQKYNMACSHFHPFTHKRHSCPEVQAYRSRMTQRFGPPEIGLETLHQSSRLHLDILHVCRQMHKEAAMLPYTDNAFHFDTLDTMRNFCMRALSLEQSNSIQKLQVGGWHLTDVRNAMELLPGLEVLQLWMPWISRHDAYRKEDIQFLKGPSASLPTVTEVEVIVGHDVKAPSSSANRQIRRKHAKDLEQLFGQGMPAAERRRVFDSW